MAELEIRELRYFIAVAEELNFTRAAERLDMAQPPLSRAIAMLESRLGVRLLDRNPRQVSLTPAGRRLLVEARQVLDAAAAAWRRTVRAEDPRLVVAVKPGGDGGLLAGILRRYQDGGDWPEVKVQVGGWGEQAAMLLDGRADVALLRAPGDNHGLDTEPLLTEARVAVLPAGHRLAGRRRLKRRDLDGERVPYWPGSDDVLTAYRAAVDLPAHTDVSAPRGPAIGNFMEMVQTVALGQGIAFVPASVAYTSAEVVFVPVSDISPSHVVVAWPRSSRSPAVAAFVRAAREIPGRLLDPV